MRELKFHQVTQILQHVDVENQSDRYQTLVVANFVPIAEVRFLDCITRYRPFEHQTVVAGSWVPGAEFHPVAPERIKAVTRRKGRMWLHK